jgi:hypothetical protein
MSPSLNRQAYKWVEAGDPVCGRDFCDTCMTRGERYQVRAKISMLYREANLFEDRQSEEGRVKAQDLRREANTLNDGLKATMMKVKSL